MTEIYFFLIKMFYIRKKQQRNEQFNNDIDVNEDKV